jgi:hypothetical protein
MEALGSAMSEVRAKGVLVALINVNPEIDATLSQFGVKSDKSTKHVSFERYEDAYRMDLWTIHAQRVRKTSADLTYEDGGLESPRAQGRKATVSGDHLMVGGETFAETHHTTVVAKAEQHLANLEAGEVANAPLGDFSGIELDSHRRARTGSNMSNHSTMSNHSNKSK